MAINANLTTRRVSLIGERALPLKRGLNDMVGRNPLLGNQAVRKNCLTPQPIKIEVAEPEKTEAEAEHVAIQTEATDKESLTVHTAPEAKAQPDQILTAQTPVEAEPKAKRKYTKRKK